MNFAKLSGLLLVLLLLTGCGPAPVKIVPVTGKITIQGAPLPWGTITLIPDTTKGNSSTLQPYGTISADGSYSLTTDGKPGAPLGAYVVTISAAKPSAPGEYKPPEWAASQDYLDRNKSGLTLTVVEIPTPGAYNLALTKK